MFDPSSSHYRTSRDLPNFDYCNVRQPCHGNSKAHNAVKLMPHLLNHNTHILNIMIYIHFLLLSLPLSLYIIYMMYIYTHDHICQYSAHTHTLCVYLFTYSSHSIYHTDIVQRGLYHALSLSLDLSVPYVYTKSQTISRKLHIRKLHIPKVSILYA